MSTSKDVPQINIKVEKSQLIDLKDLKTETTDENIGKEKDSQSLPPSDPAPVQIKQEVRKTDSDGIRKNTFFSQRSKLLALKRPQAAELEDGEVPDGDSDNDEEDPQTVCRFYLRNRCTWGNNCRFRHPCSTDLGNYVMFESVNLPLPPAVPDMYEAIYKELPLPTGWLGYQKELESSFDRNLRSLKQLMRQAGYKVGNKAAKVRYKHQPWVEFNDLDTDPYYTQLEKRSSQPGTDHNSSLPLDFKCGSTPTDRQDDLDFSAPSSSSSTPDYSSTTDSESCSSRQAQFAGICRKRKILRAPSNGRRFSSSSSPDTDSSSYGSTTHTSELSSSSIELQRHRRLNRRYKSYQEAPCKNRKYENIKLSRREYLKRKLRYVEKQIVKRSRY